MLAKINQGELQTLKLPDDGYLHTGILIITGLGIGCQSVMNQGQLGAEPLDGELTVQDRGL